MMYTEKGEAMDTAATYTIPPNLDHPAGAMLEVRAHDDGFALWLTNFAGYCVRSPKLDDWPHVLDELDMVLNWLRVAKQCPAVGIGFAVEDHPEHWHTEAARVLARHYPVPAKPWEGHQPGTTLQ